MRSRFFMIGALMLLAGCMKQPPPPKADNVKQVQALFDHWKSAFEAKDVNGVMSMYAPGDELVAYDIVPPLQFKGAEAYDKDYQSFFAQFDGPIHVDLADGHIEAGNDVAFAYGLERLTGTLKDGGTPVDMWIRYTEGLKRINGQWKVVHEHISVPADLETGKAELDLKP